MCDCCEFTETGFPIMPIDVDIETHSGMTYIKRPNGHVYLMYWNDDENIEFTSYVHYCANCGHEINN